ncbi:hypothetical protein QJQ45_026416 [Haematococcus lacustris]|nr:hypothetical protein QJQ45_026416 [Haematococcus lacustris]
MAAARQRAVQLVQLVCLPCTPRAAHLPCSLHVTDFWQNLLTYSWGQSRRQRHTLTQRLLAQPIDILQLDPMLRRVSLLEDAAVPLLRYSQYLNPDQASYMLAKLPCVARWQLSRGGGLAPGVLEPDQEQLLRLMLDVTAHRYAAVARRCSHAQLVQGLEGLALQGAWHPPAMDAAAQQLQARLAVLPGDLLSSAVWCLAASWTRHQQPPASQPYPASPAPSPDLPSHTAPFPYPELLSGVAARVASASAAFPSQPPAPAALRTTPAVPSPLAPFTARRGVAASAPVAPGVAHAAGPPTLLLDHRSVAKLAVAFEALGFSEPAAGERLAIASTHLLTQQLAAHSKASGTATLQPRMWYRYKTVRGEVVEDTQRPARPSKYLRDNSPRVCARDFELVSLGPMLRALDSTKCLTPALLEAASRQILASGPANSARSGHPPPATAALAVLKVLARSAEHQAPDLAGQLLMSFVAGSQSIPAHQRLGAAIHALAVGVQAGASTAQPGVRLLCQRLCRWLRREQREARSPRRPSGGSRKPDHVYLQKLEVQQQHRARALQTSLDTVRQLSAQQLASLATSVRQADVAGVLAARLLDEVEQLARELGPDRMDAHSACHLLHSLAEVKTSVSAQALKAGLRRVHRYPELLRQLEDHILRHVAQLTVPQALHAALALSGWSDCAPRSVELLVGQVMREAAAADGLQDWVTLCTQLSPRQARKLVGLVGDYSATVPAAQKLVVALADRAGMVLPLDT